jgi:hypothetical protein
LLMLLYPYKFTVFENIKILIDMPNELNI